MTASQLRKALRDARADGQAKDKVLADKAKVIDRQATEIEKAKQGALLVQVPTVSPDAVRAQLAEELTRRTLRIEHMIRGDLSEAIRAMLVHQEETDGGSVEDLITGAVAQIARAVDEFRVMYGLEDAPTGRDTGADLWREIQAEAQRSPEEQAQAQRDQADRLVEAAREGGNTDADIARMHPAIWAASSYSEASYADRLDS
jgi:hypothetical protein